MTPLSNAAPFLAARDFLLRHRKDYAAADRDFLWLGLAARPQEGERVSLEFWADAFARNEMQRSERVRP